MTDLYLQLVASPRLLPERRGQRQQPPLVHLEAAVFVAADDVEGEGGAVPGLVLVRHAELKHATAHRLALLGRTHAQASLFKPVSTCLNQYQPV